MEKYFENYKIWHDKKGYPNIWINRKSIKLHVYVWEKQNGEKPKGYDIHHKDFNKGNYDLSNLELLSYSDHQKLHAGWKRIDGVFSLKPCKDCKKLLSLDKFYQRKGLTPSNICIECSKKKWQQDARFKKIPKRRYLIQNEYGQYQCKGCNEWNDIKNHKFSCDKPMSYCKKCSNERQKQTRMEKKNARA